MTIRIYNFMVAIAFFMIVALPAQSRDWGKVTVVGADQRYDFRVELAISMEEQARGMMGRQSLAPDSGMLFIYKTAEPRSFWMRNVPIALDIIYINEDATIGSIVAMAKPNDPTSLPSDYPAVAVLEIAGGRVAELGIVIGDKVEHPAFKYIERSAPQ